MRSSTSLLSSTPPAPHPTRPPFLLQIRKSPLLCATLGRRYFLSTTHAVDYASHQVAAGMLVAPDELYHKVMSSMSLGTLDDNEMKDI